MTVEVQVKRITVKFSDIKAATEAVWGPRAFISNRLVLLLEALGIEILFQ